MPQAGWKGAARKDRQRFLRQSGGRHVPVFRRPAQKRVTDTAAHAVGRMEVPEEEGDREAGRRRQRLLDLNRDAARFYYQLLQQPEGRAVRDYLDRRQIRKPTAVAFGLGASLDQWDALITAMKKPSFLHGGGGPSDGAQFFRLFRRLVDRAHVAEGGLRIAVSLAA